MKLGSGLSITDKIGIIKKIRETIINRDGHEIWLGAKSKGYGLLKIDGIMYHVGKLILYCYDNFDLYDENLLALHKNECHEPSCIKYEHLYPGTIDQNIKDKIRENPIGRELC